MRVVRLVTERTVNLTFHGIGDPVRGLEAGEENVWVTREAFLEVLDRAAGRDDVVITFDDGNASDLEQALPALQERGLTATFFVVAGRLGTPGFLDTAGVRALADAGMEIGCHGMRHRRWRGLDSSALHEELVEAKRVLELVVGCPVHAAACPYGSYDRRVLRAARASGYRRVYTSDGGPAGREAFLQARTSVGPGWLERGPGVTGASRRTPARRAKLALKRWL